MSDKILTAKPADLAKIRSTLVSVIEDTIEEIKDRISDQKDAYFQELGGSVISRVDTLAVVDGVERDVIEAIEKSAQAEVVHVG